MSEIKELLDRIEYELGSEAAWSGHSYGCEYMEDFYLKLIEYMEQEGLDTKVVSTAHKEAWDEFNKRDYSEKLLSDLDRRYLIQLAYAAQQASDHAGIDIDYQCYILR